MNRGRGFRRWLRLSAGGEARSRAVEEEIEFHLRERIAELVRQGVAEDEARRQAEREFGDLGGARAELEAIDRATERRWRRARLREALLGELRGAIRSARKSPFVAAAVVGTLGLGIGATAAMFSVADRLLLSPPPHVRDADDLVRVLYRVTPATGEPRVNAIVAYADYADLRDVDVGVMSAYSPPMTRVIGRGSDGLEAHVVAVTDGFFEVLGVQPEAGRLFRPEEHAVPRGSHVIVLSHSFWQSRYGGDRSVVGRTIEIDHVPYEVVGVAPRGFTGVDPRAVDAWAPASAVAADMAGDEWHVERNMFWLSLIARLPPGASWQPLEDRATVIFAAANERRFASAREVRVAFGSIIAARSPAVGFGTPQRSGMVALWLLGVSALVLAIACANVANLLLTRGLHRAREYGVRLAMGAGRGRLALQVGAEALILNVCGLAAGLLFAHWVGGLVHKLLLPEFGWTGSPVNGRVFGFAAAVAVPSGVLAALIPALHAMRTDAAGLLRAGTRPTERPSRARASLVALQAALSLVLLAGAGLFVLSLRQLAAVPLGFQPDRVAVFQYHTTGLDWPLARFHGVYDAALERVRSLPEVEAAALGMTEPMGSSRSTSLRVPGRDTLPGPISRGVGYTPVSEEYFRTVGARIVGGRAFTTGDVPGSEQVVIVTETLADLLWPREEAVGRCVTVVGEDDVCRKVVGVVEETRYQSVEGEPTPMLFLPLAQAPGNAWRTLFVRPRGDAARAIAAVRSAMQGIEPGLPYVKARMLSEHVDPQLQPWRMGSTLFSMFGFLALTMAALGLYGVIAADVARRRREFGVRTALGARTPRLIAMVLRDAGRLLVPGLIIGLAGAGWLAGRIEPLLYHVSARDPLVLGGAAAVLLAAGLLAAAAPAWRAARLPATDALRQE